MTPSWIDAVEFLAMLLVIAGLFLLGFAWGLIGSGCLLFCLSYMVRRALRANDV